MGTIQIAGAAIILTGLTLALWCVVTFAVIGWGTPLPFAPPRRLVLTGPYRFVRNPMALGVGLVLAGASLYYRSVALFAFTALFFFLEHVMVTWYEEPTLRRTFGADYVAYCKKVNRWLPRPPRPS